jgi:hypothetical protein
VTVPLIGTAVEAMAKTPELINLDTRADAASFVRLNLERGFFTMLVKSAVVAEREASTEMRDTNRAQ